MWRWKTSLIFTDFFEKSFSVSDFLSMNCLRLGETNDLDLISCILYFWALSLLTFIVLLFSSIGKVDRTCLSLKQAGAIVSGKREMVWHNFHIHNNYYFEAIILCLYLQFCKRLSNFSHFWFCRGVVYVNYSNLHWLQYSLNDEEEEKNDGKKILHIILAHQSSFFSFLCW